jgi:hypothetical protein
MISAVNLSTTSLRAAMASRAPKYGSPASLTHRIRSPLISTIRNRYSTRRYRGACAAGYVIAHFLLFRSGGITAWLGTVIVVDNVVCSTVHSQLFDFNNGWLYVFRVGVLGGTVLQESARTPAKHALSRETVHPGSNPSVLKRSRVHRSIGKAESICSF